MTSHHLPCTFWTTILKLAVMVPHIHTMLGVTLHVFAYGLSPALVHRTHEHTMGHIAHLCVILVKVDKVTCIASSLANKVSRSSASTNTEIMAEFALHSICVIVIGTSGHTLSAIVADSTGTSLVMDNPEVATCLALKWALCTQRSGHSQSTSTDGQADT